MYIAGLARDPASYSLFVYLLDLILRKLPLVGLDVDRVAAMYQRHWKRMYVKFAAVPAIKNSRWWEELGGS